MRVAAVRAVGTVWTECGSVHGIALELLVDMFNDENDQVRIRSSASLVVSVSSLSLGDR